MTSPTNPPQSCGYASILVSVDLDPETESRVKLAGFIAESFSSRLIGVAAEEIYLPLYFEYTQPEPNPRLPSWRRVKRLRIWCMPRTASSMRHGCANPWNGIPRSVSSATSLQTLYPDTPGRPI